MLICGICYAITVQPFSTDCRHTFCATCLFGWWAWGRATTCPLCRAICQNVPVRDRSNGLASLVSDTPVGAIEPFDANRFVVLMTEIRTEAEGNEGNRGVEAQDVVVMDYTFLGGVGTSTNPLDLTGA